METARRNASDDLAARLIAAVKRQLAEGWTGSLFFCVATGRIVQTADIRRPGLTCKFCGRACRNLATRHHVKVAPRRTNDCCWLLLVSSAEAVLDLTEIKILKANGGAKGVQLLEGPRRQTGQLCKRCQRKGLKEGDTYCSLECKFSEQDVAFRSRSEEIFPAPSPLNQPCKAAPPKKRRCQSDSTCNDKKKRKPFNMSSEGDSQFGAGRHEPLGQQEERAQIGNPSEAGDGNGSASGGCATESSSPGALNSGGGDNDGSNATAQRVTRQETIGYGQLGAFGRGTRGCAKGGATTNVVKGRPRNQRVGGQLEAEDVPILAKCTHYSTNKSDKNRQYECRNTRQFPFKTCTRHLATNRQNRATRAAERKRGQNMGCSDLGALSEATAGVDWDERDEDLPGYLAAAPPELQSFLIAGTGARNKNNGENHESLLWACADAGGVETGTVMRQPGSADHYSSEPLILRKQSRTAFENGAFGPLSPSSSLVIDGKSSASEGGAPLQSERLGRPDLEPQESGDFQESIHVALSELRRVGNTPLPFDSLLEPAADPEDIPETDSFQLDANLPVPI